MIKIIIWMVVFALLLEIPRLKNHITVLDFKWKSNKKWKKEKYTTLTGGLENDRLNEKK